MLYLYSSGVAITAVTVADAVDDARDDFLALIKDCMGAVVTSAQIKYHAEILIQNWKEQKFKEILKKPEGGNLDEQVTGVVNQLNDLMSKRQSNIKTLTEVFEENRDSFFAPKPEGLKTGINFVDGLIGWIEDTDLVCIAARPAVGKSAFVTQVALNIAETGKKVQYYSMEMSNVQVLQRIIARFGKMDLKGSGWLIVLLEMKHCGSRS
jgi:replicative DNA helicase